MCQVSEGTRRGPVPVPIPSEPGTWHPAPGTRPTQEGAMSRSRRRRRRRQAAAELVLELICFFGLGFMTSSVIGIAVAWAWGMHHAEPLDQDGDSKANVPYAAGGSHGCQAPT